MHYTSPEVYEYISHHTGDPIVERKICRISGKPFAIFQSDLDFYDKISPVFNRKKYKIPTPTLCPEERQRRRLAFRNERKLYRRKCDATGESIISIYSPDKINKVYEMEERHSNRRDPLSYGIDFDENESFYDTYKKLFEAIPQMSLMNSGDMHGCGYCNYGVSSKGCYLTSMAAWSEDCLYASIPIRCTRDVDGLLNISSENCYNCIEVINCYEVKNTIKSKNCKFSDHLECCHNCEHCFACVGIHNQKYCILNEQYTRERYEEIVNSPAEKKEILEKFKILKARSPKLASSNTGSEEVYGNNCTNTKRLIFSYDCIELEDSKCCILSGAGSANNIDCNYLTGDRCYECNGSGGHNALFCGRSLYSSMILYCDHCFNCQNCFGCVGLKDKSYCIFNKQYSKEEYEILLPQIIEHMIQTGERGEFLDPSLSPFAYNETIAQEYFPLTREEAIARGYKRQDNNYDPKIPEGAQTLQGNQIPTDIETVSDEILKKIFICEISGRPFRIIEQELDFYRKYNIALPKKHPDVRHEERARQRPPRELHLRECDKCRKEMLSVYPSGISDSPVYCETCYQKEVFG